LQLAVCRLLDQRNNFTERPGALHRGDRTIQSKSLSIGRSLSMLSLGPGYRRGRLPFSGARSPRAVQ
jgi:hypothetical protein